MSEENKHINIELRSEEIQDILSRPPNWMITWGNSMLILIVLGALSISYFIKYPEVIKGRAVISTRIPPVYVASKVAGYIGDLSMDNGAIVEKGQVIAEIDNPIPSSTIAFLEHFLIKAEDFLKGAIPFDSEIEAPISLFEANTNYINLLSALSEYSALKFNQNSSQKLEELRAKLASHMKIKEISIKEGELNKTDITLAKEKFDMQQKEYKLGYVSKLEFLNAQSTYNQSLKLEESIKKSIIQIDMVVADYKAQINEFINDQNNRVKNYQERINELIGSLKNYIIKWQNDFTIRSPSSGTLDYLGRVKMNQLINAGDRLFAVIPEGGGYEVEVDMPSVGFGKVKVGQEVILKLYNFPFDEYGTINGSVSSLPLLPNQETYKLKVQLNQGLMTSYGKSLDYSPEIMGVAEVITEDLRLIERLFNSLRRIFNN